MNTEQIQRFVEALRACEIKRIVVVPASGLEALYQSFAGENECIFATREEEAVAIAAGLTLGGERAAVVMAQAGVGNCLNAVFTLADAYAIAFPIVVCFRGREDPNLVQRISAHETHRVLSALDCAEISWNMPAAVKEFQTLIENRQRWIKCSL